MPTVMGEPDASSAMIENDLTTALDETRFFHRADHLANRGATKAEDFRDSILVGLNHVTFHVKDIEQIESRGSEVTARRDRFEQFHRRVMSAFEREREVVHGSAKSTARAEQQRRDRHLHTRKTERGERKPILQNRRLENDWLANRFLATRISFTTASHLLAVADRFHLS